MKKFPTSERTDKVIVFAMEYAAARKQRPNTVHVVYGLCKERNGVGGHVLNNFCGLSHGYIDDFAQHEFAKNMGVEEPVFDLLERSLKVAENLNHNYIGTEHLLLAILADANCLGHKFLLNFNQNCDALEEELMHLLGLSGYTRSYIKDDGQFWLSHWNDWWQEEPDLHQNKWSGFALDDAGILVAMCCRKFNVGFVIRKAKDGEPSKTSFRKIDGIKCVEVYCQRDQVELVRILVVNFLVAMMSFQE